MDAGLLDMVPLPEKKELDAAWTEASKGWSTTKSEPFAVAYAVPSCSLRYQMRSLILGDVADGRSPAGVEIVAQLVANPDTDRVTWQVVDLAAALIHDGERNRRPRDKAHWAPALVQTDGRRWTEHGGPTKLWTAYSAVPPLGNQFPLLPEKNAVGATYTWRIETHDERTTAKVEARRAKRPDAAVPTFTPDVSEASLAVAGYESLRHGDAAMRAVVLEGEWTTQKTLLDPKESQRAERWRGRWVITEQGRLLHGVSMAGRYQWWETTSQERNSKLGSHDIEIRLVEDCEGPVLARFAEE